MKSVAIVSLMIAAMVVAGNKSKPSSSSSSTGSVERGKYVVENVGMCGQCHTPRNTDGELIRSRWLEGAPVPVANPYVDKPWADFAPRIAGLPQYTPTQALELLTTGTSRTGKPLRGPMPPFRMSEQDAKDVVAYLKSLE